MSTSIQEPETSNPPFAWPLLELDSKGRVRIAGTRSRVTMIAIDRNARGYSADQIHEAYPHLTLAQIHAALAYYYEHKEAIDREIEEEERLIEEFREQMEDKELAAKLRKLAGR